LTRPTLKISDIVVKDRARQLDHDWVEVLSGLIAGSSLINAITVRMVDDVPHLVTGYHRLAAHVLLEREEIPVTISHAATDDEARLEEVLENLGRNELSALDRAQHLFELKEAYEAIYPETKKGGDKQTDEARENLSEKISFRSDAAQKTGLSERSIEMAIALWKGLSPETKKRVAGTKWAKHQSTLTALSKLSPHLQKKALGPLLDDASPASNVDEALAIANKQRLPDAWSKKYAAIDRSLKSLKDDELFLVLDDFSDQIEAWLKARGRA